MLISQICQSKHSFCDSMYNNVGSGSKRTEWFDTAISNYSINQNF